eukprot:4061896-Pyramimonas_sp.AAC.1
MAVSLPWPSLRRLRRMEGHRWTSTTLALTHALRIIELGQVLAAVVGPQFPMPREHFVARPWSCRRCAAAAAGASAGT